MKIQQEDFGTTRQGEPVTKLTCTNDQGLSMSLLTYGGIMQSFFAPDRDGKFANVNLGADSIAEYENCEAYLGATVGRFCNRIGNATFSLDGRTYQLAANNGPNCLHGGNRGFSHHVWEFEPIQTEQEVGVRFQLTSPDQEEGFPGTLTTIVTYTLNNANELTMDFRAKTDAPTVINLTNHNYWNLGGDRSGSILDHVLQIEADQSLEVDATLIPTGRILDVEGTPLDFRQPKTIGHDIDGLRSTPAKGYDHCYVLRSQSGKLARAATVRCPASGRVMVIETTQPGLQLYTGNWLAGDAGSCGFGENEAFCLETQHFPDSPNRPEFPSTVLRPGEEFHQTTVHRFATE